MSKFGTLDATEQEISFKYPDIYYAKKLSIDERLTIGPSRLHIPLTLDIAKTWEQQEYCVLYVLLISHAGYKHGRYQSTLIQSYEDLELFLYTFQEFFEGDGRHHIWVSSAHREGMVIYDQHNVLFAYGDTTSYKKILNRKQFTEKEFSFPVPHTHRYLPENANLEDELMDYFQWQYFPLEDGDEY